MADSWHASGSLRPLAHLLALELQDALDRLAALTQDARQSPIAIGEGLLHPTG